MDQKLSSGSGKIWQDVQTKIRAFLLSFDFTVFKIDEFMQILSIIHSLKSIGAEFCQSDSQSLQDCVQQASRRYFYRYHHSKLDELRIFLENEGWEICPVRNDFDIKKLQEFKFLQDDTASVSIDSGIEIADRARIFVKYLNAGTPFDLKSDESDEDIYTDDVSFVKFVNIPM